MNQTTNFANSKKRMIRMSSRGVPFVGTKTGAKQYKPKAAFMLNANTGSLRVLTKSNNVPKIIAPAVRKVRSNKGVARGPRENLMLARIMNGKYNAPVRKVRVVKKVVVAGPRKVRSNKGVVRGSKKNDMDVRVKKFRAKMARIMARPPPKARKA